MALPIVLLVLSVLVTMILGLDADARRELKEAAVFRDNFKATALTHAGVEAARATLRRDILLEKQAGSSYDGLTDIWATPMPGITLGDGVVSVSIEDERGKLNLNDLARSMEPTLRAATILRFKRLCALIQVEPELVEAIVDWVDADDVPEKNGAERQYYESLQPSYRPANMALQTVDELQLIKGMTPHILQRLRRYVTVYPELSDGWININTADPLVLEALNPRITPAMALTVAQARPFQTMQDVDRVVEFGAIAQELRVLSAYTVESDYFTIRTTVAANEAIQKARTVVRRVRSDGDTQVVYFQLE